jgi:hypothetical protein
MIDFNTHLYSIGFLCCRLQMSIDDIKRQLESAGITAVLFLNDVPHFDGAAFAFLRDERRREELRDTQSFLNEQQ